MKLEIKIFALLATAFAGIHFMPVGGPCFDRAVYEAMALTKWYAREHVILCLLPAFRIAGTITAYVSMQSVMRCLCQDVPKAASCGVASVSGIFQIHQGFVPSAASLDPEPAVNVLAIMLTAKMLGLEIGLVSAGGVDAFAVMIGVLIVCIFRHDIAWKTRQNAEMTFKPMAALRVGPLGLVLLTAGRPDFGGVDTSRLVVEGQVMIGKAPSEPELKNRIAAHRS